MRQKHEAQMAVFQANNQSGDQQKALEVKAMQLSQDEQLLALKKQMDAINDNYKNQLQAITGLQPHAGLVVQHGMHDVAVRQHRALGVAGGARGVDHGGAAALGRALPRREAVGPGRHRVEIGDIGCAVVLGDHRQIGFGSGGGHQIVKRAARMADAQARRNLTPQQRLDERAKRTAELQAFATKRAESLRTFTAALSPEQRQVFDALNRLRVVDDSLSRAELYSIRGRDFRAWNGEKAPLFQVFGVQDSAAMLQYLAQQYARAETLGRQAEVYMTSLDQSGASGPMVARWQATNRDLEPMIAAGLFLVIGLWVIAQTAGWTAGLI